MRLKSTIIPNLKLLGSLEAVVSLGGVTGGKSSPNAKIAKLSDIRIQNLHVYQI